MNAQYKPYFISYHENKCGAVITICYRELCIVTKALSKIKFGLIFPLKNWMRASISSALESFSHLNPAKPMQQVAMKEKFKAINNEKSP